MIGTGAMGAAHVDNLARWVTGAAVTQIFDVDSERAKAVAERRRRVRGPDHRGADRPPTTSTPC